MLSRAERLGPTASFQVSSVRKTERSQVGIAGPTVPVAVGLVAGVALLFFSDGEIAQLAILAVILLLLVTLSIPALKRVLLAIAILEIPIQIDIYLNRDTAIADLNALNGFNLSVVTVVLVALYSLWGAELLSGLVRHHRPVSRLALPSLVYLAVVVGSLLVAADPVLALYEIVILVQAVLLFLYVLHHVRTRQDLLFVVAILMVGLVTQSLIVFGVWLLGGAVSVGPITADFDGSRINGTLGSPNVLGSYFTLLLPLALGLSLSSAGFRYRRLGGVAFGLGSVALVLSLSRGAWIGFALSVGFFLFVAWGRGWLVGAMPVVLGAVAVLLIALFQDEILLRLSAYNDEAARSRLPLMELAFSMIRDAPLLGVGANNFAVSLDPYVTVDYSKEWISTVHNKYLLVWAETGLAGLLAYLWVLIAAISTGVRHSLRMDRFTSPLALGLAAGLLGNMVHMTVELYHARIQVQMLWLVIGLLLAIPLVTRGESELPAHIGRVKAQL